MLTLLLGGARSGKSALAVAMAAAQDAPVTFVATGLPLDAEMEAKIARHQLERPADWSTDEEPVDLEAALERSSGHFVIIDCLTLWVTNVFDRGADWVLECAARLADGAAGRDAQTVMVSNEVGMGIVPMDPDTRAWRDLMGHVNQVVAARAQHVLFLAAGRAIELHDTKDAARWL